MEERIFFGVTAQICGSRRVSFLLNRVSPVGRDKGDLKQLCSGCGNDLAVRLEPASSQMCKNSAVAQLGDLNFQVDRGRQFLCTELSQDLEPVPPFHL